MEEALDYCFNFVRDTAQVWLKLAYDYADRLQFQKKIFKGNVTFDGDEFGTTALSLVYKLNQKNSTRSSLLVELNATGGKLIWLW